MPGEVKKEALKGMLEKATAVKPSPMPKAGRTALAIRPKMDISKIVTGSLLRQFPTLGRKLEMADMKVSPRDFVARVLTNAVSMTVFILFIVFLLSSTVSIPLFVLVLLAPVVFALLFVMGIGAVDVQINKRSREVEGDVLFAGRDILIALKSGVPLFNALVGVRKDYGATSREFSKVVEKIDTGVPAEIALQEAYENNRSPSFRRIMLQIIISLRSGSDIATGLEATLSQISQEQIIEIKRFGQKLNPIAMFYMMFAVILPSLGVAIGVILSSFVSFEIDFSLLMFILIFLAFVQYIFISIIRSSRPSFDI